MKKRRRRRQLSPQDEFDQLLSDLGAKLVRVKNHKVYVLGDGRRFVCSQTTSDRRALKRRIQQLRRLKAGRPIGRC